MGTCHCLPYYVHLVHTRVPFSHTHSRRVIADDREYILCGGDPPRGLSDETTSLGSWVQRWKANSSPSSPSPLDDFCSANNCLPEGHQGCGRTGRTARMLNAPIASPTASQNDLKGLYFTVDSKLSNSIFPRDGMSSSSTFSDGPVTRSKRTHQWMSGVTMLVRWLCSSPASELLPQVGMQPFFLPRPQEMHPSPTKGHVNQQAASFQRPPKQVIPVVLLSLDWARNAP